MTTQLSKENIFSTIRAVLIFAGTFVIGHNLFGNAIDSSTWQIIAASVVSAGMFVWGMVTKDTPVEGMESFLRSFLQGIGGLLVSAGRITGDMLNAILGIVTALAPLLQSFAAKAKTAQVVAGTIAPVVVAGVATGKMAIQEPPKPDLNVVADPTKPQAITSKKP